MTYSKTTHLKTEEHWEAIKESMKTSAVRKLLKAKKQKGQELDKPVYSYPCSREKRAKERLQCKRA